MPRHNFSLAKGRSWLLSVRYLICKARSRSLRKDGKKATQRIKALEQISMDERALLATKQTAVDAQRTLIGELDKQLAAERGLVRHLELHNGLLAAELNSKECHQKHLQAEAKLEDRRDRARKRDQEKKGRQEGAVKAFECMVEGLSTDGEVAQKTLKEWMKKHLNLNPYR